MMHVGAIEPPANSLKSFLLAMILYPDVQQKGQDEIDRVTGGDRLPCSKDRERLPYLNAIIKETLRWSIIAPLGGPHVLSRDMQYSGYRLPKGAIIFPAVWSFLNDAAIYPEPERFEPDRYLAPRDEPDPSREAFGYGRRRCPGQLMAENALFILISHILAVFTLGKATDKNGMAIETKRETTSGFTSLMKDFPYAISVRSGKHEEMIKAGFEQAEEESEDKLRKESDLNVRVRVEETKKIMERPDYLVWKMGWEDPA